MRSRLAEGFFQLLKRERTRRQICVTQQDTCADVFNYIKMFTPQSVANICLAASLR